MRLHHMTLFSKVGIDQPMITNTNLCGLNSRATFRAIVGHQCTRPSRTVGCAVIRNNNGTRANRLIKTIMARTFLGQEVLTSVNTLTTLRMSPGMHNQPPNLVSVSCCRKRCRTRSTGRTPTTSKYLKGALRTSRHGQPNYLSIVTCHVFATADCWKESARAPETLSKIGS